MKDLREKLKKIELLSKELCIECDEFNNLSKDTEKEHSKFAYNEGIDSKIKYILSRNVSECSKELLSKTDNVLGMVNRIKDELNYSHAFIRLREIHSFLFKNDFDNNKLILSDVGNNYGKIIQIIPFDLDRPMIKIYISDKSNYINIIRSYKNMNDIDLAEIRLISGRFAVIPSKVLSDKLFYDKYASNFITNLTEFLESLIGKNENDVNDIIKYRFMYMDEIHEKYDEESLKNIDTCDEVIKLILNNFAQKGYVE